MVEQWTATPHSRVPSASATLALLKPITWFPPMWAFACGVVSVSSSPGDRWAAIVLGVLLAGPLVCGASQAINDWHDRFVDALNEPDRVIPSGRMPGRWGLYIAWFVSGLSLLVAAVLGGWVLGAAIVGLFLAYAYSAPPLRLKANGWWGNAAVGLCYEGLPWFTAAAAAAGGFPGWPIVTVALLYSVGAHGIMTLNDFKSIEGDRRMGVGSLPVRLGAERAARFACLVMALPQAAVAALLLIWGAPFAAAAILLLLAVQLLCMRHFIAMPRSRAAWYNATGTSLYVIGMLIAAFALRSLGGIA